jgi:hypothetical protein
MFSQAKDVGSAVFLGGSGLHSLPGVRIGHPLYDLSLVHIRCFWIGKTVVRIKTETWKLNLTARITAFPVLMSVRRCFKV